MDKDVVYMCVYIYIYIYIYIHTHTQTYGIVLSHKKNEIMSFVATWVDLEIITLSKVRKRKMNTT